MIIPPVAAEGGWGLYWNHLPLWPSARFLRVGSICRLSFTQDNYFHDNYHVVFLVA